ncbi:hypothetical protein [Microbacterium sp. YY-01]|uniref:hypothetical protein n=1 Tax=Microbacterium sp. YY-01 TaxID=3421634 RepID=UPI003D181CB1
MRIWSYELLDHLDQSLGMLDGVTGGRGEIVAQSPLGGSASISLDHRQDIDWMSHRVRVIFTETDQEPGPWWEVDAADRAPRTVQSFAWGTYLLTSPKEKHTPFHLGYDVGLLTKMSILHEDTVEGRYSLAESTPIIPAVVELIRSTGEARIAVTPSDAVLTAGMTWEAGETKLRIINDLLQAAGYWSLWCDGSGQFRVEPYVDPSLRPVAFTFEHGERSLHLPDWDREQDHTSVPNRFLAVGVGDEEHEPLVGVATNENPNSPYSFQARGRWITAKEEGVEGEAQDEFDAYAERKLRDAMNPVSRLRVSHDLMQLNPNDLVAFTPEDQRQRLATVQRMSTSFTFDAVIAAEWRQVND